MALNVNMCLQNAAFFVNNSLSSDVNSDTPISKYLVYMV